MSHLPERKEKICLNCGVAVHGRFCHVCGQENIAPKERFWHLLTHFVYDITHFDGKFFSTLKYLLFRPGYLSHEYLKGRRAAYLHPIRMYVFTSAFFFLVFFGFYQKDEDYNIKKDNTTAAKVMKKLEKKKRAAQESLQDSIPETERKTVLSSLKDIEADIAVLKKNSTAFDSLKTIQRDLTLLTLNGGARNLKTVAAYDSAQQLLPETEKDHFIERKFTRQSLYLKEKYKGDVGAIYKSIVLKFVHLFPQMLFVSLPFFALILQLLYIRRRNFYYVNHVIYSIHLYCATFIIILSWLWLNSMMGYFGRGDNNWLSGIFFLVGCFYWYKAMRHFYGQGRGRTIFKYLLMQFLSIFLISFLFTAFFIFSAMAI